jgi:hypothetical protein
VVLSFLSFGLRNEKEPDGKLMLMKPQDIYLSLIEASGQWNAFDGLAIARSLRANRDIWRAVVFCDCGYQCLFDLEGKVTAIRTEFSALRGLPEDTLFFDTIRITPHAGREAQLEALAETWDADTVQWISFAEASSAYWERQEAAFTEAGFNPSQAVLEVWWD